MPNRKVFILIVVFLAAFSINQRQFKNVKVANIEEKTGVGNVPNNKRPGYPTMPKKIISVIGLESSGTTFLTGVLSRALGLNEFREGSNAYKLKRRSKNDVEVQHFSLPWGAWCEKSPNPIIQKVVLPSACTRNSGFFAACTEMAEDANITTKKYGGPQYPPRYFLDIISNKEWYESIGVEQVFVILIRDQSISRNSRTSANHCRNQTILRKEEEVGTDIMTRAINKYILNDNRKLSISSHGSWYNEAFWKDKNVTDNGNYDRNEVRRELSSVIPSGNNVFLVSYESLMKLKGVYLKMIYQALGIESDYVPPNIRDGNGKYVIPNTRDKDKTPLKLLQERSTKRKKNQTNSP